MNSDQFAIFAQTYEKELTQAVTQYPGEYAWPASQVPTMSAKMLQAIRAGNYNKDSRAIKATCKTLGVKHTYRAIDAYLGIERQ